MVSEQDGPNFDAQPSRIRHEEPNAEAGSYSCGLVSLGKRRLEKPNGIDWTFALFEAIEIK